MKIQGRSVSPNAVAQRRVTIGNNRVRVCSGVQGSSSGLLGALMVKAGVLAPMPSVPAKRARGRPAKSRNDVIQAAADTWADVTGGGGVVLVDGKPVEVSKDLP